MNAPLAGDPTFHISGATAKFMQLHSGFGDDAIYLADFGVTTNRDGTISLNTTKFQSTFDDLMRFGPNNKPDYLDGERHPPLPGHPKKVYILSTLQRTSATLNGSAMTVSGSEYTISNHDAGGLKLTITSVEPMPVFMLVKACLTHSMNSPQRYSPQMATSPKKLKITMMMLRALMKI